MKNNYFLQILYSLIKYAIYGLFFQLTLFSSLWAIELNAQIRSIKEVNVNVQFKNSPIEKVLQAIESQTEFVFVFVPEDLKEVGLISLDMSNKSVSEVLKSVSKQSKLQFRQVNRTISIKKQEVEGESSLKQLEDGLLQSKTIVGKVVSFESSEGIPGVNILIKGSMQGTVTDVEGKYTISVSSPEDVLVFSSIGFISEEVLVGNQSVINISLMPDVTSLDEVIVVGYGVQDKRDVTGAISSIKAKDIEANPQASPLLALQGQASGVDVVASSFSSGRDPQVRVRGERSILASNDPLIIMDGIPYPGSLNDINSLDIESMEILKDASATAIYGSRAANGVILITTKEGKDRLQVNLTSYWGISSPLRKVDMMNAEEFARLRREAERTKLGMEELPPDVIAFDPFELEMLDKGKSTDWQDEIYGKGSVQNYQLNLTGSTEKIKYYISGNYFSENYLIENVDFTRYSLRIKLDHNASKRTAWGVNAFFARTLSNTGGLGGTDGIDQVYRTDPLSTRVDSLGREIFLTSEDPLRFNPIFNTSRNNYIDESINTRIFPSVFVQLNFTDKIFFRVNAGGDIRFNRSNAFRGQFATSQKGEINDVSIETQEKLGYTLENILNYKESFGEHDIVFTGLFSIQESQNIKGKMEASQLNQAPLVTFYGIGDAVRFPKVSNKLIRSQLASYMGRVNYVYKDKYLATITARYDGASVFSTGNKWAFFPSVGLGWRLTDESFLAYSNILSDLKLRASFGVTGNQGIDPYDSQAGLKGTNYRFGDLDGSGFEVANIANKSLGWEKTTQFDMGVDFGFFKGRLSGSLDYYHAITEDLLYKRIIPQVTGFKSVVSNIGTTENRGVELALQSRIIDSNNFSWAINANLSTNRNKILDLYGDSKTDDVGNNLFIGHPIKVFYDNKFEGIWQLDEEETATTMGFRPGDIKMTDFNGDSIINDQDRVILGSQFPKWTAGLSSSFNVHGFDLSFLWITRQDYLVKNEFKERYNTLVSRDGNININYWTPENPSQSAPRPNRDDQPDNTRLLTYEDGSFIRLRNLTLGYSFPEHWLNQVKIQNLRVYFSLLNPLTITKFEGIDPEQPAYTGGTKFAQPANYRQTILGLNLTF